MRYGNRTNNGIKFVNPYNFVSLKNDAPPKVEDVGERLTGRIDYTLKTLTPLFIPNTSNDKIFGVKSTDEKSGSDSEYHKNYDFFSYNDLSDKGSSADNKKEYYEPVIPGSEIRGAIRSIYEAMTDSCLSSMQKPSSVARRTPETFKAGVLVWNKDKTALILQGDRGNGIPNNDLLYRSPVTSPNGRYDDDFPDRVKEKGFQDGDVVYFCRQARQPGKKGKGLVKKIERKQTAECREKGWLIIGEDGQKKHCAHVFIAGSKIAEFSRAGEHKLSELEEELCSCLDAYQENNPAFYQAYKKRLEAFFRQDEEGRTGFPVYYSRLMDDKGGEHYYFSPACITREVYYCKLDACVKKYTACTDPDTACPACSLFGMVNQNTGKSRSSRLRFSDAAVIRGTKADDGKEPNKQYYMPVVTLPELAAPKIQSTEFYLQKPNAGRLMTWTYDYYITLDENNIPRIHWYAGGEDTPVIAGRKFYWHSQTGYMENVESRQRDLTEAAGKNENSIAKGRTIRNQTVRPVKPDISFSGHLYFNGISKKELDRLIAIMDMSRAGNDGRHYAIKLGNGKPIGMGSVDLTVNQVICRDESLENGYTEKVTAGGMKKEFNALFSDLAVLHYLDYDALREDQATGYPGTERWPAKGSEGYNCFMNNRKEFAVVRGTSRVDMSRSTSSALSRGQVHFEEYLQAGNPETVRNTMDNARGGNSNTVRYTKNDRQSGNPKTVKNKMDHVRVSADVSKRAETDANGRQKIEAAEKIKQKKELTGRVKNAKDSNFRFEVEGGDNAGQVDIKYNALYIPGIDSKRGRREKIVSFWKANTKLKLEKTMIDGEQKWKCIEIPE